MFSILSILSHSFALYLELRNGVKLLEEIVSEVQYESGTTANVQQALAGRVLRQLAQLSANSLPIRLLEERLLLILRRKQCVIFDVRSLCC